MPIGTPFVNQTIDRTYLQNHGHSPELNTEEAKSTMLKLDILLLEILYHNPLETWAAKNNEGSTETNGERMGVATQWFEMSASKLPPLHIKAAEECLVLCAGASSPRTPGSRGSAVKPLRELVL